ncbi:hypothetical protein ACTT2I_10450 [Stenotrophomonas sp. PUT21]|uniref:hypothetical protein n=1 Tax=Stenotrophomonas sp. PUT21 TaxID=3456954 RepID=UPI003FCE608E
MLGWFFLPYKGTGVSFTSRFMRWHGEKFLERPEELGLKNVPTAIKDSYYDLIVDRPIEQHKGELEAWSRGQQQAEAIRQISKREIPKATFLAVLAVSLGCAVIAAPFANWSSSAVGSAVSVAKGLDFKKGFANLASMMSGKGEGADQAATGNSRIQVAAPQAATAAVRRDCEEKARTGIYASADIAPCSKVWNEMAAQGRK